MKFSDRIDRLPPFLFAELRRKISKMRVSGIDVISLGAGDPDQPTPRQVISSACDAIQQPINHQYPENIGKFEFREAVAEFMKYRFNVELNSEKEIYPVLGGKEAIHHLAILFLMEGDICLSPSPGYPPYRSAPILAGSKVYPLPLEEKNNFLPDFSKIPSDVLNNANLLYLNYPNNPTGAIATEEFFLSVIQFAKNNNIAVVHDNSYSEISFDGYKPISFLQTKGAMDVGVEVFSLSKGWNMTGWRVGWMAGNPEIIERYAHLKPNIDSGIFGAIQSGAISALNEARDFPKHMSEIYQKRRDLMIKTLTNLGISVKPQLATPFIWAKTPKGYSSMEFANLILEKAAVVVSPGNSFGKHGEGYFRIALMADDKLIVEAALRIEDALKVNSIITI
jgi:LL-diaminopimelate aminotransferase|tara:strand:- start:185 stop:1366 length:1182 start_codon:yes stop_codon:yes gene_type:complete